MAVYAVFQGIKILRMSTFKSDLEAYIKSFPKEEQRRMILTQQDKRGHYLPVKKEQTTQDKRGD